MSVQDQQLDTLKDIRRLMQRSSRFISLSGWSGIAAGIWALVGAWFAHNWIAEYRNSSVTDDYTGMDFVSLKLNLVMLALAVLGLSVLSAFYFTWRKAEQNKLPLWDHTSRRLIIHLLLPLVTGGIFILAMLQYDEWRFVAPASLIFYGLALINSSKFTLTEVHYLGISEVVLGLICTQFIGYGLYFWAFGFGVLHIIYGIIMWWRYDRKPVES